MYVKYRAPKFWISYLVYSSFLGLFLNVSTFFLILCKKNLPEFSEPILQDCECPAISTDHSLARSPEEETLDENQTFVQCVTTFFILWMKVWNFGYARINVQWNRLDKMFPNLPFSSFGSRSLKTFKWSHTFIQSLFFWGPGSMILKIFSAKNLAKKWRFRPETKLSYAKIWS
jgi:hypothetical protein